MPKIAIDWLDGDRGVTIIPEYLVDMFDKVAEVPETDSLFIAWQKAAKAFQVAEKALKALLFYYGIGLIKEHKLETQLLTEIIKIDQKAESLRDPCQFLDQFYIPTRYGSPADLEYSPQTAKRAIKFAQKILDFAVKEIKF